MRRSLIAVAVLLYAALLVRYTCYAAGGSDSSGYLNAAHLVSEGTLKVRITPMDVMALDDSWRQIFVPLGFTRAPEPRTLSPSYPLGYPLLIAPFGMIGGWNHAPFYVTPLASLLTLFILYKLAREFDVPGNLALAAVFVLAISPAWVFQSLQPMSDVVATMWCAIAMLAAFRCEPNRHRFAWAAICGASFAFAVWVRPSNILLALAIGCAMRFRWRPLAVAVAASLPFAIGMMVVNRSLYGNPFTTGYGGIDTMVSWRNIRECAPHHALWLLITLTPTVFPGGVFVFLDRHVDRWRRAALLAWFGAFFAFYSVYSVCDAWWYLRFVLPVFPPLIIGAALLVRDYVRRSDVRLVMIAVIAVVGISFGYRNHFQDLHEQEIGYPHAVHWAQKQLPPNALVTTMQLSGAYYFYAHQLTVRYEFLNPDRFEELRAYAGGAGLKWYALIFDWELPQLQKNMPGRWTTVNTERNVLLLRLDS